MSTFELNGTYGASETPCTVLCYQYRYLTWYCVEGSCNVNCTHDELEDGVNVELVSDCNTASSSEPIETLEELEAFIDS